MNKKEFYRFIEQGALQGSCRYFEYWFVYQNVPKSAKVLEIGGGFSALGQALKEKGCEVHGLEVDQKALEYQVKHGIPTAYNVENPDYKGYFDVVVAASSIEHFSPEHDGDIQQIQDVLKALKPNGLFVVTIPTGKTYIKSRGTPPEKVYTDKEFTRRFLQDFALEKMVLYRGTNIPPTDFTPKKTWKGNINFEIVNDIQEGTGLCAVLKKI